MSDRDTIFAEATAPGKAGVAIVRISGRRAADTAGRLIGSLPDPREAAVRTVRDLTGNVIDEGLVIAFPDGASFTGEPVVELQLHGSRAVVAKVLAELSRVEGARLAEPGEFTRRALENGRLDLTQVEGLADLIDAETEAQRVHAMQQATGALRDQAEAWRGKLIRAAALMEATIDFADEEVPEDVSPEVGQILSDLRSEIAEALDSTTFSERLREGFTVAIVGRPNTGKSTLLNRLAGRRAAITSETAGTTRDVIEVRMDLSGLPVTLLDTAGLRETADQVEAEGVDLARGRAANADLRVCLIDPGDAPPIDLGAEDIVLTAKADLHGGQGISGETGLGVDKLISDISERLGRRAPSSGLLTRARHRDVLSGGLAALDAALGAFDSPDAQPELIAQHLRDAVRSLDRLVGRVDVEHILGEIFASFCLGK